MIQYVAGKTKGQTENGDIFNSPFRLGKVDPEYTSDKVTEMSVNGVNKLAWTPVVKGAFEVQVGSEMVKYDVKVINGAGAVEYHNVAADGVTVEGVTTAGFKMAYQYDNVVIPQNDIPTLRAEMKSIALIAKARRIAVYFSQIAAFQAKTDYGFDLGDQLAEKAVGQLSYEIDTEITDLLINNAAEPADGSLVWSKTLPIGISKMEHYQGFTEIIEIARQKIYDLTKRFSPNYMLIASNILPVLTFINGFTAAPAGQVNGPYFCGTLNSLKVYVTPNIAPGTFVIGVNGDDMMSSAAVYAPLTDCAFAA